MDRCIFSRRRRSTLSALQCGAWPFCDKKKKKKKNNFQAADATPPALAALRAKKDACLLKQVDGFPAVQGMFGASATHWQPLSSKFLLRAPGVELILVAQGMGQVHIEDARAAIGNKTPAQVISASSVQAPALFGLEAINRFIAPRLKASVAMQSAT